MRRLVALGLVGALVISACGGDDGTTTTSPAETSAPATDDTTGGEPSDTTAPGGTDATDAPEAPVISDRTLRVVVAAEPPSLNPVNLAQSTGILWGPIFEAGLIALDGDFRPSADGLITAWERPEPTTWRFTLREGVTFHNGEPFDAEAVKFTIETYQASEGSPMRPYLLAVSSVDVVDELTVDLTTESPDLSLPAVLTAVRALPPAYYAEVGPEEFGLNPVGVGPFVFDSWTPGTSISLTANPEYWRGLPGSAGIEFSFAADAATRVSLLQTGDADLITNVPSQLREDLRTGDGTTTVESVTRAQPVLFQITNKPQLEDPELRAAVELALDREALTEFVLEGEGGVPASEMLSPLFFTPTEQEIPAADIEAARAIVDAKGNPTITLTWAPAQFTSGQQVGEAVAGMLEEVGFTVTRNPLDPGDFTAALVGGQLDGLALYRIVPVFPHPKVYVQGFLTTTSITKACNTPGIDEMNLEGIAAEDEAESDAIYAEIEELAIHTDHCLSILYNEVDSWGLGDDVTGFTAPVASIIDYFPISFSS